MKQSNNNPIEKPLFLMREDFGITNKYLLLTHNGQQRYFKRCDDIEIVEDGIKFFKVDPVMSNNEILIYELIPEDYKP